MKYKKQKHMKVTDNARHLSRKPKVIGIILAYKHATYITTLSKNLPQDALDAIIITNDASGDDTEVVAKRLRIPVFSHPRLGYGGNMKYGLAKALELGADYMVEIHGDGQYDPNFIKPALKKISRGYDLILATRFIDKAQPLKDQMPSIKYFANIGLSFIESLILGIHVSEFHTGARIYSRKAIETINIESTSNNFLFGFEIIAQIAYHNFKIGEVPGRSYYGKEHTSISIKDSIVYAIGTFKVLGEYILARLGFRTKLFP